MWLLFTQDEEFAENVNNTTHRLPLIWFVNDVEEIYEEFKSRNIEIADELKEHSYDLLEFAFIDINGYYIRVAEENK